MRGHFPTFKKIRFWVNILKTFNIWFEYWSCRERQPLRNAVSVKARHMLCHSFQVGICKYNRYIDYFLLGIVTDLLSLM